MEFREGVRLAFEQIRSQKLKSFFSVLGVIIGVMFLIVVVSVVEGIDRYMKEDFAAEVYGVNTIIVRRTPSVQINPSAEIRRAWNRRPRLRREDAEALATRLGPSIPVGVESHRTTQVLGEGGRAVDNVQVSALSFEALGIRRLEVEEGRPFSAQEAEHGAAVLILGKSTAELLFPESSAVGQRVRIGGYAFRVVGILEEQGSLLGMSRDNRAIGPDRSVLSRITNPRGIVDEIIAQAPTPEEVPALRAEAEGIMRTLRGLRPIEGNDFEVESSDASLSFWERISTILFMALPGLVSISLVVGGIVIMNIMLVSVMERTREIGVRKALGARKRDIVSQVLIESATLSSLGAILGVAVGVGLGALVRAVSPLPAVAAPHWIAIGVLIGTTVGIVAGVYPASRAANLDPVDALRYE